VQQDVRLGPEADIAPNPAHSLRRHYDGDGMHRRAADFDDEWRGGKLEFHTLADTLATRSATGRQGFPHVTILRHINPAFGRQSYLVCAGLRRATTWMKPANVSGDFGARSGATGSLASANGTSARVVAQGMGHATRSADMSFGRSVPLSVARSLSSGHLNLSQPTGSNAKAGPVNTQATRTMVADLTTMPYSTRDHDIGRFDDGYCRGTNLKSEIIHRFVGDRRSNDLTGSDFKADMRRRGTLLQLQYFAFDLIACANSHGVDLIVLFMAVSAVSLSLGRAASAWCRRARKEKLLAVDLIGRDRVKARHRRKPFVPYPARRCI